MSSSGSEKFSAGEIARRFVQARRDAISLPGFPGALPDKLNDAYACQDAAIRIWNDDIIGWKIGRIPPALETKFGQARLAGPIFRRGLREAVPGRTVSFPVFVGGFAAVEAEYVFEIAHDTPPDKHDWSLAEAQASYSRVFIGVETAGSPLAAINALGPTSVISDFGNNAGLILGLEIGDWHSRPVEDFRCETFIEGQSVGRGGASELPGGPIEALRFLLAHCARQGRPLKAGMLVSSGAATGIHDIRAGQSARVAFGRDGEILCRAVAAEPEPASGSR